MNSTTKIVRLLNGAFLFSSLFLGLSIQAAGKKASCYSIYRELQVQRIGGTERKENSFAGTDTPIVKAFEKDCFIPILLSGLIEQIEPPH